MQINSDPRSMCVFNIINLNRLEYHTCGQARITIRTKHQPLSDRILLAFKEIFE